MMLTRMLTMLKERMIEAMVLAATLKSAAIGDMADSLMEDGRTKRDLTDCGLGEVATPTRSVCGLSLLPTSWAAAASNASSAGRLAF